MDFGDLEKRLTKFFHQTTKTEFKPSTETRQHILSAFVQEKNKTPLPSFLEIFLRRVLNSRKQLTTAVALASIGVFWMLSNLSEDIYAGKILPKFGPVEIVREGKTILVKEEMDLQVGDLVRVGNNAEAKVTLPNQMVSTARTRTSFQVVDDKTIFLEKGELKNTAFRGAEIATERGVVESAPGAEFLVNVSGSGETEITPEKNWVHVFDLNNRKAVLNAGDKLTLRTDTVLAGHDEIPDDLLLSKAQLRAIRAKLVISRSKLLTGVDQLLVGKDSAAKKDIVSAQKTFRSIAQVLYTARNLEITKRRNLASIKNSDILALVKTKTQDEELLQEIAGIENLFVIVDQSTDQIAFAPTDTGVESFDRYVLLKQLFALGKEEQQVGQEVLLNKYIIAFLRKVQNEELRIDQLTVLNAEVEKLPKTQLAREFLGQSMNLFAPDVAGILEEKLQKTF